MDKVYIELRRKNGKLIPEGFENLFEGYSSEQLEAISKKVDGCDVVECPILKKDEYGHVTEFGLPVPV